MNWNLSEFKVETFAPLVQNPNLCLSDKSAGRNQNAVVFIHNIS